MKGETDMIRSDKRSILILLPLVIVSFIIALSGEAAWADDGYSNSCLYRNSNAQNYGGGHMLADIFNASTVRSFLIPCDDGKLMRVHSYKGSNGILVEYYDKDLNLVSSSVRKIGLPNPGAIYADGDYYYVISGRKGLTSYKDNEIVHIVKYDESWKKIASTGIKGFTDTMVFYDQPVRAAETGRYLIFRTATYQGGHNVSLEIVLDKETMEIVGDTRNGTLDATGFTSHCFDSYVAADGNDVVTVEVTDAGACGALISRRKFDPESKNYVSFSTDSFHQGYMLKGSGTYDTYENCCGISVGGFEMSENKLIAVGTTIDLKNISKSRTRNVYLAVADKPTKLDERSSEYNGSQIADVTMLTSYPEGSDIANTPQLVRISNDRYLVIWSRGGPLDPTSNDEEDGTIYYQMIDGNGNLIGKQYSFKGILSDCKPVIYNGSVIWYTRHIGKMTFYSINANDISKYSIKDIPLVKEHFRTELDCFTPATFDDYGYSGYLSCKDCGDNLGPNHRVNAFGSCYLTDDESYEYNEFIYTGKKIIPYLIASANVKEGVDYKLDLPANILNVGTYSAKVTLMGNYTGSKTLWFKVIPALSRCSIKAQKRKIKITMKKPASAYGGSQFQIKYRIKGKKWKTITVSSQKKTLKKLKKGKKYNVKVRAFKRVNGKTYYGDWYCKTVKVK